MKHSIKCHDLCWGRLSVLLSGLLLRPRQNFQSRDNLQCSPYSTSHLHCIFHILPVECYYMRVSYILLFIFRCQLFQSVGSYLHDNQICTMPTSPHPHFPFFSHWVFQIFMKSSKLSRTLFLKSKERTKEIWI